MGISGSMLLSCFLGMCVKTLLLRLWLTLLLWLPWRCLWWLLRFMWLLHVGIRRGHIGRLGGGEVGSQQFVKEFG